MMFQKNSALALWYRRKTAGHRVTTCKTMIVALARKLFVATNSAKLTSPITELRERPMHDGTNLPVPERTSIPGDCATLELSRSGCNVAGGNGRELLDLLARLKTRADRDQRRRKRY